MSAKSLLNDDMDTDDVHRDSIEWLKSDFDAHPVANLDFLMETGNNDVFDVHHTISSNQRQAKLESRDGREYTPGKGKRKKPSSSSYVVQQGSTDSSPPKPTKKRNNTKGRSTGVSKNGGTTKAISTTNNHPPPSSTSSSSSDRKQW